MKENTLNLLHFLAPLLFCNGLAEALELTSVPIAIQATADGLAIQTLLSVDAPFVEIGKSSKDFVKSGVTLTKPDQVLATFLKGVFEEDVSLVESVTHTDSESGVNDYKALVRFLRDTYYGDQAEVSVLGKIPVEMGWVYAIARTGKQPMILLLPIYGDKGGDFKWHMRTRSPFLDLIGLSIRERLAKATQRSVDPAATLSDGLSLLVGAARINEAEAANLKKAIERIETSGGASGFTTESQRRFDGTLSKVPEDKRGVFFQDLFGKLKSIDLVLDLGPMLVTVGKLDGQTNVSHWYKDPQAGLLLTNFNQQTLLDSWLQQAVSSVSFNPPDQRESLRALSSLLKRSTGGGKK